jgi:hypothetical protein
MAAPLNKQPIFTATPILIVKGTDIQQNTSNTYNTDNCTDIYVDDSTYGSLITKITVNANGKIGANVSNKRIDLYILNKESEKYVLYQSRYMTGISGITPVDTIPSVIFEFPQGLITQPTSKLALSATENNSNSGEDGDYVSIIIEGGTYDQPA